MVPDEFGPKAARSLASCVDERILALPIVDAIVALHGNDVDDSTSIIVDVHAHDESYMPLPDPCHIGDPSGT